MGQDVFIGKFLSIPASQEDENAGQGNSIDGDTERIAVYEEGEWSRCLLFGLLLDIVLISFLPQSLMSGTGLGTLFMAALPRLATAY